MTRTTHPSERDSPVIFLHRTCTAEPGKISNLGVLIVAHTCGFVAQSLLLPPKCSKCSSALKVSAAPPMPAYSLIGYKTLGGLMYANCLMCDYFLLFPLDHRKFFSVYYTLTKAPAPTPSKNIAWEYLQTITKTAGIGDSQTEHHFGPHGTGTPAFIPPSGACISDVHQLHFIPVTARTVILKRPFVKEGRVCV